MHSIHDLEVWKKAREFRMEVSALCVNFPAEERYILRSQLLKASRSVAANIAEGYGRYNYQENIQFLRIARGSLYECYEHLICAKDEGYIDDIQFDEILNRFEVLSRMLNGYIRYLRRKKR